MNMNMNNTVPSLYETANVAAKPGVIIKKNSPHAEESYAKQKSPPCTGKRQHPKHTRDMSSTQRRRAPKSNHRRKNNPKPSFPVVLMAIISAPHNAEYISFLSDGLSFIIIDAISFETKVLPIYFEDSKPKTYDQFVQLLYAWGFEGTQDLNYPSVKVFQHPMFRKGDWERCLQIQLPHGGKKSHRHLEIVAPSSHSITVNLEDDMRTRSTTMQTSNKPSSLSSMTHHALPPFTPAQNTSKTFHPNADDKLRSLVAVANNYCMNMNRRVTQDATPEEVVAAAYYNYELKLQKYLWSERNQYRRMENRSNFPGLMYRDTCSSIPLPPRRASLNDVIDVRARMFDNSPTLGNLSAAHWKVQQLRQQQQQQEQQQQHEQQRDVIMRLLHRDHITKFPLSMIRTTTTPSDEEVRSATEDIVSAAIDVLHPSKSTKQRRCTVDDLPHRSTSDYCASFDEIAATFLERSSRNVLSSRNDKITK